MTAGKHLLEAARPVPLGPSPNGLVADPDDRGHVRERTALPKKPKGLKAGAVLMIGGLLVALLEGLLAFFPIDAESAAHADFESVLRRARTAVKVTPNTSSGNWYYYAI
jgi:hypothetical protein